MYKIRLLNVAIAFVLFLAKRKEWAQGYLLIAGIIAAAGNLCWQHY